MSFRLSPLLPIVLMVYAFFRQGADAGITAQPAKHFLNRADMDTTVRPGDNFCQYAEGNWLKNNPIPGFTTHWGTFDEMRQSIADKFHTLLDSLAALPIVMLVSCHTLIDG